MPNVSSKDNKIEDLKQKLAATIFLLTDSKSDLEFLEMVTKMSNDTDRSDLNINITQINELTKTVKSFIENCLETYKKIRLEITNLENKEPKD